MANIQIFKLCESQSLRDSFDRSRYFLLAPGNKNIINIKILKILIISYLQFSSMSQIFASKVTTEIKWIWITLNTYRCCSWYFVFHFLCKRWHQFMIDTVYLNLLWWDCLTLTPTLLLLCFRCLCGNILFALFLFFAFAWLLCGLWLGLVFGLLLRWL